MPSRGGITLGSILGGSFCSISRLISATDSCRLRLERAPRVRSESCTSSFHPTTAQWQVAAPVRSMTANQDTSRAQETPAKRVTSSATVAPTIPKTTNSHWPAASPSQPPPAVAAAVAPPGKCRNSSPQAETTVSTMPSPCTKRLYGGTPCFRYRSRRPLSKAKISGKK